MRLAAGMRCGGEKELAISRQRSADSYQQTAISGQRTPGSLAEPFPNQGHAAYGSAILARQESQWLLADHFEPES